MNFKPVDEMSLRHLFSSAFAQDVLRMSYIGPVLNDAGLIETSPDCMILDMRKSPFRPLRCEFKFSPSGKEEFSHNGRFDIAIVWSLQPGCRREQLTEDLLSQNGCFEVIVLNEFKAFGDLPIYSVQSLSRLNAVGIVREKALSGENYSAHVLYIAARIYPEKFQMDKMVELLMKRFPKVKRMQPKGRANAVSAFIQTKPRLITHMHGKYYRWTSDIDSVVATNELSEVIISNFGEDLPSSDDLVSVK